MTAGQLFRNLYNSEKTGAAYAELVALVEHSARIQAGGDSTSYVVFREELDRLRNALAEMEDDADDCRDKIIAAGYTPEQYEAWTTQAVR